jgi:hypothetical protein
MGGWNQSQAHAQFVSNVVDHGMNIQAALEAPRFTKLSFDGNDVAIERRISADAQRDLAARGHELQVEGDFCSFMGGGQAVMRGRRELRRVRSAQRRGSYSEPVTNNGITKNRRTNREKQTAGRLSSDPPVSLHACFIRFSFFALPYTVLTT